MADNPEDFGEFGTSAPASKRFSFRSFFRLFIVAFILLLIPVTVYCWRLVQGSFAEQVPPVLRILDAPPGIGIEPSTLRLEIEDAGAGVDEVIVRAEQGSEIRTLYKMNYETAVKKEIVEIPLKGKAGGFREGSVRITATAFDRSFWSNSASTSITLDADFRKPRIEVVTKQHNAVRGGVELVFYRILGDQDGFSGVAVGPELYPGFLARKLDSDFEQAPDVYFSSSPYLESSTKAKKQCKSSLVIRWGTPLLPQCFIESATESTNPARKKSTKRNWKKSPRSFIRSTSKIRLR